MSELPSDGRKLGDGQGQLFILLVQQQWGSPRRRRDAALCCDLRGDSVRGGGGKS
ncbi:hypothetical protein ALC57_03291 [Trachymyrmex cornetzi]|uniref:Uncharacterized protein n=1 Tax=Trachymyrmex cornetzi TaxID=471704 RepID=A0A195EF95_9HYME|nr:hypothetical protein ALC57_03291 [Trachymyrmex cornetzi]